MTFKRGSVHWAWVRWGEGCHKRASLGTGDRRLAEDMERMLHVLRDRREWELLQAAAEGPLSVGVLYDHWRRDDLDALRARLNDVDLQAHVEPWRSWLEMRVSPGTAAKYLKQLRELLPADEIFLRSHLTRARVTTALHELEASRSGSTVRRYHAAWSSFFGYLIDIEVLHENPARRVRLPRENRARERSLSLDMSARLVEAHAPPFRALAALREGAGVEIGAALRTRRRDIDRDTRTVHIHGTKARARDRFVRMDEWAWPHFDEHLRTLLPDALLWEGITADAARHAHRQACKAVKLADYRMHDARHSYAVRHMKAGDDPFLIANQLGHTDATMVLKVYGKYRPRPEDLRRLSGAQGGER